MTSRSRKFASLLLAMISLISFRAVAASAAESPSSDLEAVQRQINKIKSDEAAERDRVNSDEQIIRQLEQQLRAITARDANLVNKDDQLELSNTQLKAQTQEQIQQVKAQLDQGISPSEFGPAIDPLSVERISLRGTAPPPVTLSTIVETILNTFAVERSATGHLPAQ